MGVGPSSAPAEAIATVKEEADPATNKDSLLFSDQYKAQRVKNVRPQISQHLNLTLLVHEYSGPFGVDD